MSGPLSFVPIAACVVILAIAASTALRVERLHRAVRAIHELLAVHVIFAFPEDEGAGAVRERAARLRALLSELGHLYALDVTSSAAGERER